MSLQTNPFGVDKAYDWKNTRRNSRAQNTTAGAAVGTGVNAGIFGGLGAAVGTKQARRGLGQLRSVGAAPSHARSAGIVVGHAARQARRTGVPFGVLGATIGAAEGAAAKARKRPVRKSAFGVDEPEDLRKARFDRRKMQLGAHLLIEGKSRSGARLVASGARGMAQDPDTRAAVSRGALRTAAATGGVGAGAVIGSAVARHRKTQHVTKSAFGVEFPDRG